jgi:zinc protease
MVNRLIQPPFGKIQEIRIPSIEELQLDNALRLFLINVPGTEILRIEFQFDAGSWYQAKKLIANTTGSALLEGTKKRNDKEIAEIIDFYGAFIDIGFDHDYASLTLFTLNKYLPQTLDIIKDILSNSSFPEKNLSIFLNKRKQSFIIESQKVKNIARKKFSEVLFGKDHPYGVSAEAEDFDQVTRDEVLSFFHQYYHPARCRVFVSGAIGKNFVPLFAKFFGESAWKKLVPPGKPEFVIHTDTLKSHFVRKDDAVQSAVRIGCGIVTRDHEDFISLQVLNTILGGYFGSRLMKNIREEKGYTYGIGSAIIPLLEAGVFVIVSEVGNEYRENTVKEIYFEIQRLKEEIISEEELNLVKNFMLGDLMRSADGPFQVVDIWKSIIEFNLPLDYFEKSIHEIKQSTGEKIRHLANHYLIYDSLIEVVAGN